MSFLSKLGLRNWFKKTKQPAAIRTHLNKPLSIESLETRITPAITTVPGHGGTGRILYITQTNAPDTLNISLTGTTLTIAGAGVTGNAFGVTAAGNSYTLNLTSAGANGINGFAGIWVDQLLSQDTLNVSGLDFGKSDPLSTATITTNNNI